MHTNNDSIYDNICIQLIYPHTHRTHSHIGVRRGITQSCISYAQKTSLNFHILCSESITQNSISYALGGKHPSKCHILIDMCRMAGTCTCASVHLYTTKHNRVYLCHSLHTKVGGGRRGAVPAACPRRRAAVRRDGRP